MYYKNINTDAVVAESYEELMAYYERTYRENIEEGYISEEDCTLEEWINEDQDVVLVEE